MLHKNIVSENLYWLLIFYFACLDCRDVLSLVSYDSNQRVFMAGQSLLFEDLFFLSNYKINLFNEKET